MRRPTLAATAALLVVACPSALAAQVATVDEGAFTITRNGEPIGREEFRIVRRPSGASAVLIATSTANYDGRRLNPALETDTSGFPLGYQLEVRTGPDVQERLTGVITRGRFSMRSRTPRGESGKEYIVSSGALILDDDVFHQYYFLHGRTGTIPVVVPRRNVQLSMRVDVRGAETVTIGGRAIPATHLVLTETGGPARHIWLDSAGRVLRVTIPDRGISAVRDQPPR